MCTAKSPSPEQGRGFQMNRPGRRNVQIERIGADSLDVSLLVQELNCLQAEARQMICSFIIKAQEPTRVVHVGIPSAEHRHDRSVRNSFVLLLPLFDVLEGELAIRVGSSSIA